MSDAESVERGPQRWMPVIVVVLATIHGAMFVWYAVLGWFWLMPLPVVMVALAIWTNRNVAWTSYYRGSTDTYRSIRLRGY